MSLNIAKSYEYIALSHVLRLLIIRVLKYSVKVVVSHIQLADFR